MKNNQKISGGRRLFRTSTVLASLCVFSFSVSAATVICEGEVEQILMHANDKVMVKLTSMNVPVFVCNTTTTWSVAGTPYQTSPETCKTLVSIFLSSKATKTPIKSVYFDGDQVPASCDAWQNWSSANIRYFSY